MLSSNLWHIRLTPIILKQNLIHFERGGLRGEGVDKGRIQMKRYRGGDHCIAFVVVFYICKQYIIKRGGIAHTLICLAAMQCVVAVGENQC